jgi:hypothetical protein
MFRLVSDGWEKEVLDARRASPASLRIACPFIKAGTLKRILAAGKNKSIEVITRFDLNCFYEGVNDLEALEMLLDSRAKVRGINGLHAKLFLFGSNTAIGTSANVTDAGMRRNREFGFVSDDEDVVQYCDRYFAGLWDDAGKNLTRANLRDWKKVVAAAKRESGNGKKPRLPDYGTKGPNKTSLAARSPAKSHENQAFLKFLGDSGKRTPREWKIADIVAESGCNWACTYPTSQRPRQVEDGDIMYMARIAEPEDLLIFGYATGWRHREDEDVASPAEIKTRNWKKRFRNYVRVHDAHFIDAELGVGISMYQMLDELGPDAWRSTQDNVRKGKGNADPFASYLRKPGMQLTEQSRSWIQERLERLFRKYGEVDLRQARFKPLN